MMETAIKLKTYQDSEKRLLKKQLVKDHLPYVKRIAQKVVAYLPSNIIEMDDLINAGVIGLIQAAERFDPSRDNKFITYAMFRIKGAILSELRSRDYLSRSNRKKMRELNDTHSRLEQQYGREISDVEMAAALGLKLEQFYKIKKMSGISFVSFDEIGHFSPEDKKSIVNNFNDTDRSDAFTLTKLKEIGSATAKAIEQLPEKEKIVISLYYQEGLTMREAGEVLNITESRVSQIHSQAIIHLRENLKDKGLLDDYLNSG